MNERPTPLRKCPTPWKHAYATPGEALRGFIVAEYTRPHRPYRCVCGFHHITSHVEPKRSPTPGYSQPDRFRHQAGRRE